MRSHPLLSALFLMLCIGSAKADTAVIHACVNASGTMRIVTGTTACGKNETSLEWSVQGPKGDTGTTGAAGPTGPAGADASLTLTNSCSGDVASVTTCSTGGCNTNSYPCNPYTCDANSKSCALACISSAECAQGASCDTVSGRCATVNSTCVDTFAIGTANGQIVSCSPYKCLNGMCQQQCVFDYDCSDGFKCSSSHCVVSP